MTSHDTPVSSRGGSNFPRNQADGAPDNLLRHYAAVLRRRVRWVALAVVVGLAAGYVSTLFVKPVSAIRYFKATNTVVVNSSAGPDNNTATLQQAALLVHSQALLDQAAKKLQLTPLDVSEHVAAILRTNGIALDVTGISTNPLQAAALADTAASLLNEQAAAVAQQQAAKRRADLTAQLQGQESQLADAQQKLLGNGGDTAALRAQISTLQGSISQLGTLIQQIDAAPPATLSSLTPAHPVEINQKGFNLWRSYNINTAGQLPSDNQGQLPSGFDDTNLSTPALESKTTRLAIGGAAGLVLGVLSAFLVEAWDDRVRRRDRVEALTGLPVLAEIPRLSNDEARHRQVALVDFTSGPAAERYRAARTSVLFALEATIAERPAGDTRPAPVLLVTSPGPREGKSTTATNLASACADSGTRVLLLDADLHRPTLGQFVSPEVDADSPEEPAPTRVEGVWFLAGPREAPSPGEAVQQLRGTIARWRHDFDLVVVDTPPMLATNDAVDLLTDADGVVLVLRVGQTRAGSAQRAAEMLTRYDAPVLGIVLNACERSEMYQYYGYGYSYGYGDGGRDRREAPRRDKEHRHRTSGHHPNGTGPSNGEADEPARSTDDAAGERSSTPGA